MTSLMQDSSRDIFAQIVQAAPNDAEAMFGTLSAAFHQQSKSWRHTTENRKPGRDIQAIFDQTTAGASTDDKRTLARYCCARMALALVDRIRAEKLPGSVLAYYPTEFERMAQQLQAHAQGQLDQGDNLLERRTRFLLCLTVPCGAQDLDLSERVPLTSALIAIPRERSLRSLIHYIRCRGTGVWFRPHTNTDRLEEFNETGWDHFYLRVAQVLALHEQVRGLALTSWFYDPALKEISPRLAYLQMRPQERGAHLMKHASSPHAIEFATRTSDTRRQLYEKGEYLPTEYSIVWGRKELLAWAAQQQG